MKTMEKEKLNDIKQQAEAKYPYPRGACKVARMQIDGKRYSYMQRLIKEMNVSNKS